MITDPGLIVTIHSVSHRLELAIQDSLLRHKEFVQVKDFMQTLFYLFKQSGKLMRHSKGSRNKICKPCSVRLGSSAL